MCALDLQAAPQAEGVEWLWTPPGGTEETVPPDVLRTGGGTAPGAVPPWPAVPPPIACP